jgi:hypothetical protein
MAGTKNGFVKTNMVGCRVATTDKNPMRYVPAHTKADGSFVSARLEIPVLVNEYGSKDPDAYKLVAWGGRADMFAKALSQGKEMNFYLTPKSYFRKVYNNQNQVVMQPDGSGPLMVRSLSFTIRDFTWGADSEKLVGLEIAAGIRGAGWNNPNSPDYTAWRSMIDARKSLFYDGVSPTFGYAKVMPVPEGCTVLPGDQSANARRTGGNAGQPTTQLVDQVSSTLDPKTGFPIANAQATGANAGV